VAQARALVMALDPDPTIGAYLQGVVVGFGLSLEGAG
jgi:hypothetical protein